MVKSRPAAGKAIVALVVLLLAAVLLYAYLLLNSGDTSSAYPDQPENVAYGDEAVVFEDLGTMTASSDLVVSGTVLGAAPGRSHNFPQAAGGPETERDLEVLVDEVVYNRHEVPVPTRIVVVEGWWSAGEGFAWEGMPWSEKGDTAYFYLVTEEGSSTRDPYSYVSTAGRLLVDSEGIHPSGDRGAGPWASLSSALQVAAVDSVADQAAKAARSGRAQPAPEPPVYEATETEEGATSE